MEWGLELAAARVDEERILASYKRRGLPGLFRLLGEQPKQSADMFRRMAKVCGVPNVETVASAIERMA